MGLLLSLAPSISIIPASLSYRPLRPPFLAAFPPYPIDPYPIDPSGPLSTTDHWANATQYRESVVECLDFELALALDELVIVNALTSA